jgi:hypothetical protein
MYRETPTNYKIDDTLYFTHVKLEEGGSATSWTPALEDSFLNQQEIFDTLTNNGEDQGIYLLNNKIYINADLIQTGTLNADLIRTGTLSIVKNSNIIFKAEAAGDNGSVTIGGFEVGKDYIKANITDSEFGDAEFSLHTDPQSGEAIKIVGLNK